MVPAPPVAKTTLFAVGEERDVSGCLGLRVFKGFGRLAEDVVPKDGADVGVFGRHCGELERRGYSYLDYAFKSTEHFLRREEVDVS